MLEKGHGGLYKAPTKENVCVFSRDTDKTSLKPEFLFGLPVVIAQMRGF